MEELLINRVKERDFLFDSKAPRYKDRNLRLRAWEEIGKELDMKPELVKEKWLKLRRCFTNALNRRRIKKNDQAVNKIMSWKFGKQMSFLLPHLDNRRNPPIAAEAVECKLEEIEKQSDDEDQDMESQADKNGTANDDDVLNDDNDSIDQNLNDIMRNEDNNTPRTMHMSHYLDKRESEIDDAHAQDIVRLLKENSNLLQMSFSQGKPPSRSTKETNFTDLDESDMFYLSMSKMAKRLPQVSQAKIKLLLSQAVLEAEIANLGRQVENEVLNLSSCISPGTEFQSSSTASAHQST